MKLAFLLLVAMTSGCASSYRVDPSRIDITITPPSQPCGSHVQDIPIVIGVKNGSRGLLKIGVWGKEGPPYDVSWLYYDVLNESGVVDWQHGPGGHGPMPPNTLSIGPGDSTSVFATLYAIDVADQSSRFRIRLEDLDKHRYTTKLVYPCLLPGAQPDRSAPNNSFKPKPLRGSA